MALAINKRARAYGFIIVHFMNCVKQFYLDCVSNFSFFRERYTLLIMITLLSPSKTMQSSKLGPPTSPILFRDKTTELQDILFDYSAKKLETVLDVSESLAQKNYEVIQNWPYTDATPALLIYRGDVYNGLDAKTMDVDDWSFAQEHIMVISGMYGLLRPSDGIVPYRLEMRCKHPNGTQSLYEYWSTLLSNYIENTKCNELLICASKEYSRAVLKHISPSIRTVQPRFMQRDKTGELREKGLFAKYARGRMARWVIDEKIDTIDDIRNYSCDDVLFSEELSTKSEFVFIFPDNFTLKGRFKK